MGRYLDKIKLIDSVEGMVRNVYKLPLAKIAEKEVLDYFCKEIMPEEDNLLNPEYTAFLLSQNTDFVKEIRSELRYSNSSIKFFLNNVSEEDRIIFSSEKELEWFKYIIGTRYGYKHKEIINFLKDNLDKENDFFKILNLAESEKWGSKDWLEYKTYRRFYIWKGHDQTYYKINIDEIFGMVINDNFCNQSNEDIVNFVNNNDVFGLDYSNVSMEQINVAKDTLAIKLPILTQNALDLAKSLSIYIDCKSVDLFKQCTSLFENFEETSELVKTAIEANKTYVLKNIIKAASLNFVQDNKDIILITNKIKYGEVFKSYKNIGYLLSGVGSIETLQDTNYASLIKLRKIVSKNFYKMIISEKDLVNIASRLGMGAVELISNIIELGQLNKNQFIQLTDLLKIKGYLFYNSLRSKGLIKTEIRMEDMGYKISFSEFVEVIENSNLINFGDIVTYKNMKSSERLLKIKELVELYSAIDNSQCIFTKEVILLALGDKSIKREMKINNPLKISTMYEYLNYMVLNGFKTIGSIEDYRKLLLIEKFVGISNMGDMSIDEAVMSCSEVNEILESLGLSEEFTRVNIDSILSFCASEDFSIVSAYLKNEKINSSQIDGINLIAKSIIAGKYNNLKFVYEDIAKESGAEISIESFASWSRTDEMSIGRYTVRDASDFNTIMKMGVEPVKSCMNYVSGSYSRCLLSNFDTTKKMITIHKNGKYVGRAVLRLTKMSDNDIAQKSLKFLDVDSEEDATEKAMKEEELIIFLEKAYTTLDSCDFKEAYEIIVDLLKIKAKSLGAKLVVSNSYENYIEENDSCIMEHKYVYITASKNGQQYLDSFDGSTSSAHCYKMGQVYIYN